MAFLNVLRPCQDRFQTVSWLRRDFYGDLSLSPFVFRPCSMLHAKRFWSFPNRHTIEQSDQSWFLQGRDMSRTIRGVCFWHPIVLFFSSVQSSFAPCLTGPLGSILVYQKAPLWSGDSATLPPRFGHVTKMSAAEFVKCFLYNLLPLRESTAHCKGQALVWNCPITLARRETLLK